MQVVHPAACVLLEPVMGYSSCDLSPGATVSFVGCCAAIV